MQIYINTSEEELLITFIHKNRSHVSGELWQGTVINQQNLFVSFIEINGDITNLKYSSEIITNRQVLIERLSDALSEWKQVENEGFENTEEGEKIQSEIIEDPYNPDDIKVRKDVFSIPQIFAKIRKKDLDLNPSFQRHFVWDSKRKSKLIESILLGIPLPVFYFAEDKEGVFQVIDGLQRLSTIRDFILNQFELTNLEHLAKTCEKKFFGNVDDLNRGAIEMKENKVLERRFQRRIENAQLSVNIIEASSPAKVKYDIFKRINEGGKPLNQQEIRNSLAKDATRKLLQKLSTSPEFELATGGINDQRMSAQEIVLRFIGFLQVKKKKLDYWGDMNVFLDSTNEIVNSLNERELKEIESAFLRAMKNANHLFGEYAFRKYLPEQLKKENVKKQLLNKALFVTWSVTLSAYDYESVVQKISPKQFAFILADDLMSNRTYLDGISHRTSDRKILEMAFENAERLAQQYL